MKRKLEKGYSGSGKLVTGFPDFFNMQVFTGMFSQESVFLL